jgi:hypothetical protein
VSFCSQNRVPLLHSSLRRLLLVQRWWSAPHPAGRRDPIGKEWMQRDFSWEFETKELLRLYNKILKA